ncbi:hypothetical protein ACQEVF_41495 [Nonomuraea polychroma]|uniref:hypothetical protein n=1 Tax=Nonomuraea polychroma TaxID=46176 RepID=UPI003D925FC6
MSRARCAAAFEPRFVPDPGPYQVVNAITLTRTRNSGTLPDPTRIPADIADYRNLEASLGISPRRISINEYAAPAEVDVPGRVAGYAAKLGRGGRALDVGVAQQGGSGRGKGQRASAPGASARSSGNGWAGRGVIPATPKPALPRRVDLCRIRGVLFAFVRFESVT